MEFADWTLLPSEVALLANKTGPTRLGFAVLLLLVANAGSSRLKFALFKKNKADQLVAKAAGQVQGIGTWPRFTLKNAAGHTLFDCVHNPNEALHHGGAIALIRSLLRQHAAVKDATAGP